MRSALRAAVAAAAVAVLVNPASALRVAFRPPAQRLLSAEVVVAGKVASIEKDLVEAAAPYAGAKEKQKFQVAVVKVETGLAGADKLKEVRVGVFQPPKADPNAPRPGGIRPPRGPAPTFELKEGQELLLFLVKHPSADFYIFTGMSPPVDLKDEQGAKDFEAVQKLAAVLADPSKGLKSDKPEVRAETAAAVVMKYRSYPELGGEVTEAAVPADESKRLLKALAEGDWGGNARPGAAHGNPTPVQAFFSLGLTDKDGWVPPIVVNNPGAPPIDFNAVQKDAFMKWLEGPGKNYQIKKIVPKKQ